MVEVGCDAVTLDGPPAKKPTVLVATVGDVAVPAELKAVNWNS